MPTQLKLGTDTVQPLGRYMLLEPKGVTGTRDKRCTWWIVRHAKRGTSLGNIEWYPAWRQWIFAPALGTVFNNTCLRDLADFLHEQNRT